MMTPVGRLIMLRSFRKDELVAAMSYMAIPALLGPAIGPLVGGFFATYMSWRWIFYINLPIGLTGIALSWRFIENFQTAERTRFDVRGFVIIGLGLALLQLGIEYLGREVVPAAVETLLFLSSALLLIAYGRHARDHASPVLDLKLFDIRSFRISVLGGSLCRAGIGAVPFLLPLLFQIGFGFDAMRSGMLTFIAGIGAVVMRGAMPMLLKRLGFRRMIVGNGILVSIMIAGVALLRVDTPSWLVMAYLLIFGFARSTQFSSITMLGYADLTPPMMSRGAGIMSVAQQFSTSVGIALGATLVAVIGGSERAISAADFRLVFIIVSLVPLASIVGFLRLRPLDGSAMSGHSASAAASGSLRAFLRRRPGG
jgi:MFS family permease